jgi:hypothetical protein
MNNSKSPKPTQKTIETSWTLDSTDIVRTQSKSLVEGGPNGINETDLSNEMDAFRLFWNEKLERNSCNIVTKKWRQRCYSGRLSLLSLHFFDYGCRAFSKSKGSLK